MSYKHLLYQKEDGIGLVTINRPELLNALDSRVFTEVFKLFQEIEDDPEVGVILPTSVQITVQELALISLLHRQVMSFRLSMDQYT